MMSWDSYFLNLVEEISKKSEDLDTKVGCVIVGQNNEIRSTGYNGLPMGVFVTHERLKRPNKYFYFSHAERNAIFLAARVGNPLAGSKLYCQWVPCADCGRAIIQSGIKTVVVNKIYREKWESKEKWKESMYATVNMFSEAKVRLLMYNPDTKTTIHYPYP